MKDENETKSPIDPSSSENNSDEPEVLAVKRQGAVWRLSRRGMLIAAATGAGAIVMDGCSDSANTNNSNVNSNKANTNSNATPGPTPRIGNSNRGFQQASPSPSTGGGGGGGGGPEPSKPSPSPTSTTTRRVIPSDRHYWRPN